MNEKIKRFFRKMTGEMYIRGKALNLREEHRIQRHEDGSYTLLIRMIPPGGSVEGNSVDGIIVNESRGFWALHRGQIEAGR